MPDRPTLSILIPLYNGSEFPAECLKTLISQCDPAETEIILCDDCSTDNTYSIAAEYARRSAAIRLYRNDANLGMDGNFIRKKWIDNQDRNIHVCEHEEHGEEVSCLNGN